MIEKEEAKMKAEEIKDILAPLLKKKLNQEARVEEKKDGRDRRYYKVTWSTLKKRTFAAVNMKGQLTVHRAPAEDLIAYKHHIGKLKEAGFKIGQDIHGKVNNKYVEWSISNLEKLVKLRFRYY